jgi:hypothetical protein
MAALRVRDYLDTVFLFSRGPLEPWRLLGSPTLEGLAGEPPLLARTPMRSTMPEASSILRYVADVDRPLE